MDLDVLILAAGLGTRMKSNLAKVLHRLDGRPLINHVCETAMTLAPRTICTVVGHQADDVKSAVLGELAEDKAVFALQERQLGTGDAVNAARPLFEGRDSTLLVLSGDVPMITSATLSALIEKHASDRAACTILSVKLEDPTGYGRVIKNKENGSFIAIVEHKDATEEQRSEAEINSGIYCFDTQKLFAALASVTNDNAQGEYYLTDVPHILAQQGERIGVFLCRDHREVEGVNDRRQLAAMERVVREHTVEKLMVESGVSFIEPQNVYVSSRATMGRDTVVAPNVMIEGATSIGSNCTIRPGVRIVNSVIGDNVEIKDNTFITDSTVGSGCDVGPMAHLRGKAVMQNGAKVGNFVELKKTNLGKGSKASHLTYLGDATIGEKTNIGAGTITCNYDGKNKHATTIGDGVKIGSSTMLVAPVTVGDRAVTGAGSVVTKDIEPDTVVAGVPAKPLKAKTTRDPDAEQKRSPEQISSDESLVRVQNFKAREEKFVAAVEKSQN